MTKEFEEKLRDFVEEQVYLLDMAGAAVSVRIAPGSSLHEEGWDFKTASGVRDVEDGEKLQDSHVFHCASISKTFTATGIMQLVENGVLSLDDYLKNLLPGVPGDDPRFGDIQLKHMLAHTSGLGDVEDYEWEARCTDEDALIRYCCSDEVRKAPMVNSPADNAFKYSNIAYEMLGAIISRYSQMSFEDYMMKNLIVPAGMVNSTFMTPDRTDGVLSFDRMKKTDMAFPHCKDEGNHIIRERCYPYNREHGPSSTLTSTVSDLGRWAEAHMNHRLLVAETYEKVWKRITTVPNNGEGMGLGWFIRRQRGCTLYGHEGTDDGFRGSFWLCPELKMSIAVLADMSKSPVKKINKKIFEKVYTEFSEK